MRSGSIIYGFYQKLVNKNGHERCVDFVNNKNGSRLLIRPRIFMTEFLCAFLAKHNYGVKEEVHSGCDAVCVVHNYFMDPEHAIKFQDDFINNTNNIKNEWEKSLRTVLKAILLLKKTEQFLEPIYQQGDVFFEYKSQGIKIGKYVSRYNLKEIMSQDNVESYTASLISDIEKMSIGLQMVRVSYENLIRVLDKFPEFYHYKIENDVLLVSSRLIGATFSDSNVTFNESNKCFEMVISAKWFETCHVDASSRIEKILQTILDDKAKVQSLINLFNKHGLVCYFGQCAGSREFNLICYTSDNIEMQTIKVITEFFPGAVTLKGPQHFFINADAFSKINPDLVEQFSNAVDQRATFINLCVRLCNSYGIKAHEYIGVPVNESDYVAKLIELGEAHFKWVEERCILDEQKSLDDKKMAELNLRLLVSALQPFIKSENWCKDSDRYFAATDRKSQALIACLNVPGLALTSDGVSIGREQISQNIGANGLAYRAQRLIKGVALLDTLVCHFRHHNVLSKAKSREYDEGFVFAFRSEQEFNQFPFPRILQKTAISNLFTIPYTACFGNDLTPELLEDALRRVVQQRAVVQPSANEPEVTVKVRKPQPAVVRATNTSASVVKKPKSKTSNIMRSSPAAVKASKGKNVVTVKAPTVSQPAARTPKFFQMQANMVQPASRGLMPSRERDDQYVVVDLATMNQKQLDLTTFAENHEKRAEMKEIKQHANAHQGAIEYELNFLTCSNVWFQKLEEKGELYQKIHHYNSWFSVTRLMNALGLRLELLPKCVHVTSDDKAAMSARAKLLHGNPTAGFTDKLREYIIQHHLSDKLSQVFNGLDVRNQCDINLFFSHHFQADARPLDVLITEVFVDLCMFVDHFDHKTRDNPALAYKMGPTNILYFEARAIQACIVKLGEYYKQAKNSDVLKMLPEEVSMFMRSCKPPRNVGTHNNIYNHTFDPISLPVMLKQARKGKLAWEHVSHSRFMAYSK